MSKQELQALCEEKVAAAEREKDALKSNPEYKFYSEFFKKYQIKDLESISKITPVDATIALLNANIKDANFEKISEDVKSFAYILTDLHGLKIDEINNVFSIFIKNGMYDLLIQGLCFPVNVLTLVGYDVDKEIEKRINDIFEMLRNIRKENKASIANFVSYYEKHFEEMFMVMDIIVKLRALSDWYKRIDVAATINPRVEGKISERVYKNINDYTNAVFDNTDMCSKFGVIETHYNSLHNKYNLDSRKFNKDIKLYTGFINRLQKAFNVSEVRDYEAMIKDIPDEDVKVEFLKSVYAHNNSEYDKTMASYNATVNSPLNRITLLLKDTGISIDEVEINSIMRNEYDDIVKMLKILRSMFNSKNTIIKALETARLVDVLYLQELVSKDVLSIDSIITNPSLFDGESDARKVLDENIKALNEFGFNPSILGLNQDLLVGSELLRDGLGVLREYDLLKYIKGQNNYSFLGNKELVTKIDKFLELGYEGFIKEDITLLNEDNIDRIYALKGIGIIPKSKEELLDYLRTDRFLVSDDKLSEYIHDVVLYTNDEFKLDINSIIRDYDATNRTISINGVVLSKNRIKRNSNLGSFKAIITGSVLSMDEVNLLREELKDKELIKNS